jgi:mannose-6-phosphate isomerase-like protein (cupin superfamily)
VIEVRPGVNELQAIVVMDLLEKKGIRHATLTPGNDCVWAYYGYINEYYIFREGRVVDIQID